MSLSIHPSETLIIPSSSGWKFPEPADLGGGLQHPSCTGKLHGAYLCTPAEAVAAQLCTPIETVGAGLCTSDQTTSAIQAVTAYSGFTGCRLLKKVSLLISLFSLFKLRCSLRHLFYHAI